jgi:hypothetical protein
VVEGWGCMWERKRGFESWRRVDSVGEVKEVFVLADGGVHDGSLELVRVGLVRW